MTVILARQIGEAKFGFAAALPQEIGVDFGGQCLGLAHELGERRRLEMQQYARGLDLAPFAVRGFHLKRSPAFGEHGSDLERAGLFVQHVHGIWTEGIGLLERRLRVRRFAREVRRSRCVRIGAIARNEIIL